METIKNAQGKTICRADETTRRFEIVFKGVRSIVWFDENGLLHQEHELPPLRC